MSSRRGIRLRQKSRDLADETPVIELEDGNNKLNRTYKSQNIQEYNCDPSNVTSWQYLLLLSSLIILLFCAVQAGHYLPTGVLIKQENITRYRFVAEHALNNLKELTEGGPRVSGSIQADHAARWLVGKARSIADNANPMLLVDVDVQKMSGAFALTFLDGMTNVYRDMESVIVRISPAHFTANDSLLINCHYDTVADSPGASDDGAGCAVMLEILRVLSQSSRPFLHNIVFLFNGAEENIMQASHGFITQHHWAPAVRAFINLEACGAGGRELLFQAGPHHPELLETYAAKAPYPYASSLAQEIFQSGIIPGDTDFRVFRDFGNISGLDFAWSSNGYVYHTKLDTVDQIPLGSLQRTGDNILALVRALASDPHLSQPKKGSVVFFDFLGLFVVQYSETSALMFNSFAVVFALGVIIRNFHTGTSQEVGKRRKNLYALLWWGGALLTSWTAGLITTLLISSFLTTCGRTMSWFSKPSLLLPLYACPSVCASVAVIAAVTAYWRPTLAAKRTHSLASESAYVLCHDAVLAMWTVVLALCVMLRLRSGFIPVLWVIFPTVGSVAREVVLKNKPADWRYLVILLATTTIPFMQTTYLGLGALSLFVPLTGRAGAALPVEPLLAAIISLGMSSLLSYALTAVTLIKQPLKALYPMVAISITTLLIILFTKFGFPYTFTSPQRYMIVHTNRTFVNNEGTVRNQDSGYWFVDLDARSPDAVANIVPEVQNAKSAVIECERELYCGFPYLLPALSLVGHTHWLPGPPLLSGPNVTFNLVSRIRDNDLVKLGFNITGPDHMGIILSPVKDVEMVRWTLTDDIPLAGPLWNGRKTYFVYFAYTGMMRPLFFEVSLKIDQLEMKSDGLIDLVVVGHILHGPKQMSGSLETLIKAFPDWTTVTAWTSTLTSYRL